jgi:steroid delta-isomerase-like uncharacterized protein
MATELDTDEQKALVRRLYERLYENADFDAIGEFYAPDAVRHGGLRGDLEGREAIRGYLEATLSGLSDLEVTEHRCVAEDDVVVYDFDMTGTHDGELMGIPATGNRVETTNAAIFRIEDGLVAEEWPRSDVLGLLVGIGAVEAPF